MNELPNPIHELLDDRRDAVSLQNVRRRLMQRPHRRALPWRLPALFAVAAAAATWLFLLPEAPKQERVAEAPAGPLMRADGQPVGTLAAERQLRVPLSDGSHIGLAPGSLLHTQTSTARRVVLNLERGQAEFEVKPGGPRRWRVDAGLAQVEVVGTHFRVERQSKWVDIHVTRGKVRVRARSLPNGSRLLTRGQHVRVRSAVHVDSVPPGQEPGPHLKELHELQ